MGRLFDSFKYLDRTWHDRVLEQAPPHCISWVLLVMVFAFGIMTGVALHKSVSPQRFDWGDGIFLASLAVLAFRYARIISRQLDGNTLDK